jgi:uncharacterized membrane protein
LLLLIGVATAIIGIGLVLVIVAEIMLAISFFSIREPLQTSMPPASTS